MPRIRSIHPGFWTDEAVVSVSRDARLFFIGIWNQCDDKGVFEWKPVSLRMRVFPAEQIDVVLLLTELERADLIRAFEADGRRFGVVRNFVIFQRPKKPNDLYPLSPELWLYSGLGPDGSPPVRNRWGNRMTEGEGKGKGERIKGDTPFAPLPPKKEPSPTPPTKRGRGFQAHLSIVKDDADGT
jgi:hypothetical protein